MKVIYRIYYVASFLPGVLTLSLLAGKGGWEELGTYILAMGSSFLLTATGIALAIFAASNSVKSRWLWVSTVIAASPGVFALATAQ